MGPCAGIIFDAVQRPATPTSSSPFQGEEGEPNSASSREENAAAGLLFSPPDKGER